jgi:hypothetical protein
VHRHFRSLAGEDVADVAARLRGTGLQQNELREVAAVERQAFDLRAAHELAECRAARFDADARCAPRHAHALGERAELHREIELRVLPDRQLDDHARRLESLQFRRHLVLANVLVRERVAPTFIAGGMARLIGCDGPDRDRGAGQYCARAVLHDARDAGVPVLRVRRWTEEKNAEAAETAKAGPHGILCLRSVLRLHPILGWRDVLCLCCVLRPRCGLCGL